MRTRRGVVTIVSLVALGLWSVADTLHGQTEKGIRIRDGSVEAELVGSKDSSLEDKTNDKHKWSEKARTVRVWFGSVAGSDACGGTEPDKSAKEQLGPVEFESVSFTVPDQENSVRYDFTARNRGIFAELHLHMDGGIQFRSDPSNPRLWRLESAKRPAGLKLSQITVKAKHVLSASVVAAGADEYLCAEFRH